jgi:parvulin-like peptidyl-prolyl isomerase
MEQINTTIKQQLDSGSANQPSTGAELAALQLSVLDNLIQAEVLLQKAQREKLDPDDAKVSQEIERQKQEARLTEDEYQKRLKQKGMTEAALRDQVKTQLAINALHEKENARVKAPTDQDIRRYYDEHRNQFVAERGAEISVIVTDPANNAVPEDAIGEAAAEQKIRAIYSELKATPPPDFATVASQRSEDPASRTQDGKLGFATEAQLNQTFGTQMAARLMTMSPGQYTEPIKDNSSGRWYILKVNSKREQAQNRTFDDARQEIITAITQQRQEVLWNALLRAATAEASIKNFLADRIVENPETVVMMKPSEVAAPTLAPEQPQPRFENQNRAPASGAPLGSKSPARNPNQ